MREPMSDEELQELEDEGTWDWERLENHPPSASARAIISVPFSAGELERVESRARESGLTLSEFIRRAALDRVLTEDRVSS